jgi:hypothetical protein
MRKLIFDLDRTLWRCTIEYHPRIRKLPIHRETQAVLSHLQNNGYSLNIASRSAEPEKCHIFLDTYFPNIHFDKKAIYPTPYTKLEHIWALDAQNGHFIMFDDEIDILKSIKYIFPESITVLCDKPLQWNTIINPLLNIELS